METKTKGKVMNLKQDSLKGFLREYTTNNVDNMNSSHDICSLEDVKVLTKKFPSDVVQINVVFEERTSHGEIQVPITYSIKKHDDMYSVLGAVNKDINFKKYN